MNERIEQLWEQGTDVVMPVSGNYALVSPEGIKKFAELIVEECCDVLQNEDIRYGGYGYNQGFLHKKIKEHFGVEQ